MSDVIYYVIKMTTSVDASWSPVATEEVAFDQFPVSNRAYTRAIVAATIAPTVAATIAPCIRPITIEPTINSTHEILTYGNSFSYIF